MQRKTRFEFQMLFCCFLLLLGFYQSATLLSKNLQIDVSSQFPTLKDLLKTQLIGKNWIGVEDVFNRVTPRAGLFEHKQTKEIILATKETSMPQTEIVENIQYVIGGEYDEISNRIKEKNWTKMFRSWIHITPWCKDHWTQDFLEALADVVDIEQIDKYERSRIHRAAEYMNIGVVEALLKRPDVNPNLRDERGETVLHIVATWPHLVVRKWIRMLLEYGADIDATDNEGRTPLMHASDWGLYCPVQTLLECGANPNLKSKSGETALHFAANLYLTSESERLFILQRNGYSFCTETSESKRHPYANIIQILLIHGAKIK